MNNINYQKELDKLLAGLNNHASRRPRLLLHSCCAPCSSYCLVYLREYFDISCFYYNPNITQESEYNKRVAELYRLAEALNNDPVRIIKDEKGQYSLDYSHGVENHTLDHLGSIDVINGSYEPEIFLQRVSQLSLESEPEGGRRCVQCFNIRLSEAVNKAMETKADYVTTSLTISPLKNASLLNEIGRSLVERVEVDTSLRWLPSDFKKRNGYKMSVELSDRYGLYRQNYCGCDFSKRE